MSLPGNGRDGGASRRRMMADSLAGVQEQAESTGTASGEAPVTLERAPGASDGTESLPFWFHRDHGAEAASLQPKENVLEESSSSVAQVFAAEHFPEDVKGDQESESTLQEMLGVRCHLDIVQNQLLAEGTGETPPFGVPLMFAEVSCASVPLSPAPGQLPVMLIFAVIPSAGEVLNTGDKVAEGSRAVWYFLSQDVELRTDILDIFSLCGCLRRDLNEAYRNSNPTQVLLIGEGAYAKVHAMAHRTGRTMAVKKINAGVQVKSILNEISTQLQVHDHVNIIGFRGLFYAYEGDTLRLSAVFDLAPHGDLLYRVMRYDAMREPAARPLFRGILSALTYIHQHQIVHRDIKAENVLLMGETHAAVADFGLAARMSDSAEMARRCGSPGYVACEVCLGQPYGAKVDSFSAGVVLYFMLSQEMPFSSPDHDTAKTMQRTVRCNLHLQNPPWSGMSSRLRNILRSLICKNQSQRVSSEAALEHPWFNVAEQPAPQRNIQPEPVAVGPIVEGSHLPDVANAGHETTYPSQQAALPDEFRNAPAFYSQWDQSTRDRATVIFAQAISQYRGRDRHPEFDLLAQHEFGISESQVTELCKYFRMVRNAEAFRQGYAVAPGGFHQPVAAPAAHADDRLGQEYSPPHVGQPYPVGLISPAVHACVQYPAAGYGPGAPEASYGAHAAGSPDVSYGAAAHAARGLASGGYAPGAYPPGNISGGYAANGAPTGSRGAGPGAGYAADPET